MTRQPKGTLRIVLGVLGTLLGLLFLTAGLGLLLIHGSARDEDGFFTSEAPEVTAPGYAVTTDRIDLGTDADWVPDEVLGDLRIRATAPSGEPVFLGIGRSDAVAGYLGEVARSELTDIDGDGDPVLSDRAGRKPSRPPADAGVWIAEAEGPGTQEVVWDPEPGTWTAVLMNGDGSRGISADISVGMKVGWVLWVGIALGLLGLILGGAGALAIVSGSRRRAARIAAEREPEGGGAGGATPGG